MMVWNKILNWYFSKKALPYWCIFLIDGIFVLLSGLFTYWVFNKTMEMFTHRIEVLYTSLFYMMISWLSARECQGTGQWHQGNAGTSLSHDSRQLAIGNNL